jgi:phenylpyruvate tautomerase PptA (4-oxalocrotonate tautomerase family)
MSPFELVRAIQSAGVDVVGMDSRRTVVVLRSVDDQDVGGDGSDSSPVRFPANRKIRRVPRGVKNVEQ